MRAIVLVGGNLGDVVASDLPQHEFLVAADSGLHHARTLGVSVDLLIGDLDSVDPAVIGDTPVWQHPIDKDASDTELAVECAINEGATEVILVGGEGGRLDHFLAIAFGMCRDEWAATSITAIIGRSRLYVMRSAVELDGVPGQYVSQFAVGGDVRDLHITGLRWSGHFDLVRRGSTQHLSNEFSEDHCVLRIGSGTMLVVHELGERPSTNRF